MNHRLIGGDCRAVLAELPPDSIDACVTDPPYEIGFMGAAWDRRGVSFDPATWGAVARVLKPGGHLLAFGGTRTWHRIACAIEDAGFEIRDSIAWMYGQGFPKSLDVSKAIDKHLGAEREVVGTYTRSLAMHPGNEGVDAWRDNYTGIVNITEPATTDAKQWDGWGTALKPAFEPIIVARKPLIGTVAANVLAHGTGGLNIDGCRIEGSVPKTVQDRSDSIYGGGKGLAPDGYQESNPHPAGRWPANVLLDDVTAELLDEQTGELAPGNHPAKRRGIGFTENGGHANAGTEGERRPTEAGGASRFFYVAKAAKRERSAGLPEGMVNDHPTVKPVELMRWLIRLVAAPGMTIVDPFCGSGTTGIAAEIEGVSSVLIDDHPIWLDIAERRIRARAPLLASVERISHNGLVAAE